MFLIRLLVIATSSLCVLASDPTFAPVLGYYQIETFVSYLALEQVGSPRANLTTLSAIQCLTSALTTLLPGITTADIFWNTSTFYTGSEAIWNTEQTTYLQFEISYAPASVGFFGTNQGQTFNGQGELSATNGWSGQYAKDVNCRDCWDSADTSYLQYKDLIQENVASGKFVSNLVASCPASFSLVTYAYSTFTTPVSVTAGAPINAKRRMWGLPYVWVLFLLVIPVAIAFYGWYNGFGFTTSRYDEEKLKEMEIINTPEHAEEHQQEGDVEENRG